MTRRSRPRWSASPKPTSCWCRVCRPTPTIPRLHYFAAALLLGTGPKQTAMRTIYLTSSGKRIARRVTIRLPAERSATFKHTVAPAIEIGFEDGRATVADHVAERLIASGFATGSVRAWARSLIESVPAVSQKLHLSSCADFRSRLSIASRQMRVSLFRAPAPHPLRSS
jgi:hypothetical protein